MDRLVQESRDSSLHLEKLHRNLLTEPVDRLSLWHPELIPVPSPVLQGCLSESTGLHLGSHGLWNRTSPWYCSPVGGVQLLSGWLTHEIHLVQRQLGLISCPGERVGAVLPHVMWPDPVSRFSTRLLSRDPHLAHSSWRLESVIHPRATGAG